MVTTFLFDVFILFDAAKTAIWGWCWSLNDRCTNNCFSCSELRNLRRLNLRSRRHLGGVHVRRVQIGRHRRHVQIRLHKIVGSILWLGRLHWLLHLLSVCWLLIANLSVRLLLHLWLLRILLTLEATLVILIGLLDLPLWNHRSSVLLRDGVVNSHHVSSLDDCLS